MIAGPAKGRNARMPLRRPSRAARCEFGLLRLQFGSKNLVIHFARNRLTEGHVLADRLGRDNRTLQRVAALRFPEQQNPVACRATFRLKS